MKGTETPQQFLSHPYDRYVPLLVFAVAADRLSSSRPTAREGRGAVRHTAIGLCLRTDSGANTAANCGSCPFESSLLATADWSGMLQASRMELHACRLRSIDTVRVAWNRYSWI